MQFLSHLGFRETKTLIIKKSFSEAEFIVTSLVVSPETVQFVSSANRWGLVSFRHSGKSFMYNRKIKDGELSLVEHHIVFFFER